MSEENKYTNPYEVAPSKSFWRTAVAQKQGGTNYEIYSKKFDINKELKIATAGSCFAQHIGARLRKNSFNVLDYEEIHWSFPYELKSKFGYSAYSARYGNIYTVRQLLQLVKEAFGIYKPIDIVWQKKNGRFIDALRPGVEHLGLESPEEVMFHRDYHLSKVKSLFQDMELFIFTLGLTEAWVNKKTGVVYPIVPGAVGGVFDSDRYEFVNFDYLEIKKDLLELIDILNQNSFKKKFLFTVSPVPLTATATQDHVMVATNYSKSVLRSVVGSLSKENPDIDYFPSYEIIVNPWAIDKKYKENQRDVLPAAVDEVMRIFLNEHCKDESSGDALNLKLNHSENLHKLGESDVVCEEIFLDFLSKDGK